MATDLCGPHVNSPGDVFGRNLLSKQRSMPERFLTKLRITVFVIETEVICERWKRVGERASGETAQLMSSEIGGPLNLWTVSTLESGAGVN